MPTAKNFDLPIAAPGTPTAPDIWAQMNNAAHESHRRRAAWDPCDYEGDPTGFTDSTSAILAAIEACQNAGGGKVGWEGDLKTTGITIDGGPPVHFEGSGGISQLYSSGELVRAKSRLISVTNAPILKITDSDKSSLPNIGSSIRDIAILGDQAAGSSQIGLVVDQRGFDAMFVVIAGCGGRGADLIDNVGGTFIKFIVHRNKGEGCRIDPSAGTGTASAETATTYVNFQSLYNGAHGLVMQGAAWGHAFFGGILEGNGQDGQGWGLICDVVGGGSPRFNYIAGMWMEGNAAERDEDGTILTPGSAEIHNTSVQDNEFHFGRLDTPPTGAPGFERRNEITYSDLSATGDGQRRSHQIGVQRSNRGLNSSDIDTAVDRNYNDSDDGARRLKKLYVVDRTVVLDRDDITPANTPFHSTGTGTPEGAVTAPKGSTYGRLDGGAGTSWYVKESGSGNTGWVGK